MTRCLLLFGIALTWFLAGCSRAHRPPLALPACGNSVVLQDWKKAVLLTYDPQAQEMHQLDGVQPAGAVVDDALLRCDLGGFIYQTEERESSSVTSVMHLRAGGTESTLTFKEGINGMVPLGERQLLVQTKVIRQAPIDEALGSLAQEEARRLPLALKSDPSSAREDVPPNTHVYLDDVVLDLVTLQRARTLRGPLMPHRLQGHRWITYGMYEGVYEFDPITGHRKRIHSHGGYSADSAPPGRPAMQFGVQYYVWGDRLYAVNGQNRLPATARPDQAFHPANTVLELDEASGHWAPVAEFGFRADATRMSEDQLVLAGVDRFAVFNLSSRHLRVVPLPLGGLEPASIAAIDAGWLLALTEPSDVPGQYRPKGTELWLVSRDDFTPRRVHRLPGMAPVRMSTQLSPVPSW